MYFDSFYFSQENPLFKDVVMSQKSSKGHSFLDSDFLRPKHSSSLFPKAMFTVTKNAWPTAALLKSTHSHPGLGFLNFGNHKFVLSPDPC